MIRYNYKGFSTLYEINQLDVELYAAEAKIFKLNGGVTCVKKIYTEKETSKKAHKDILKLIEKFVDIESEKRH